MVRERCSLQSASHGSRPNLVSAKRREPERTWMEKLEAQTQFMRHRTTPQTPPFSTNTFDWTISLARSSGLKFGLGKTSVKF